MEKSKTNWIYGLKILIAIMIVVHHFFLFFYPALFDGLIDSVRTKDALELLLIKTPFNIFDWIGNVGVCFFFLLSGFLIAYKKFFKKDENIISSFPKRFIRLVIPILYSSLIITFVLYCARMINSDLLCSNVLGRTGQLCTYTPNFVTAIKESLYGVFVSGNSSFNPVLWTMSVELKGSFFSYAIVSLIKNDKKRFYIYFFTIILTSNSYYFTFILGIILCDLYINLKKIDDLNLFFKFLIFVIGLYFCGFTYANSDTVYYNLLPRFVSDPLCFYHSIGAFFLLIFVCSSNFVKNILSKQCFLTYKNLSLNIYLFHWIIVNSLSFLIVRILTNYLPYVYSCCISLILTIVVTVVFSILLDNWTIKLNEKISLFFENKVL